MMNLPKQMVARDIFLDITAWQDCANSLLPRYYLIFRVGSNSTFSKAPHWAIMDNPNDLPLPALQVLLRILTILGDV